MRLIFLRGKEAPALARALMHIKNSIEAYIDKDRAFITAQYPCKLLKQVYGLISYASLKEVDITLIGRPMSRAVPRYWKYLKSKGEWTLSD